MKLSDVMGASGLSVYAIVALLIFVGVFVATVVWVFHPANAERYARDAQLPLDDEPTVRPPSAKE